MGKKPRPEPKLEFDDATGKAIINSYMRLKPAYDPRTVWVTGLKHWPNYRWVTETDVALEDGAVERRHYLTKRDSGDAKYAEYSAPAVFEYGTRAPLGWEAFKELELQFSLDELSTYAEGLELMRLISGANSLGQNPLLSAQWHGWELLVSAASVLKMIAAPTERVLNVICDPRQGFVRLNTKRSTSDVVVLTAIDELMLWRPTPRELECLAFWLATPGLRRRFQSTYVSLQEGTQIELPRVPGQISLRADGITDGNRLLISDFRLSWAYTRATWPRTWSKVILEDIVGCDTFSVSAGSVTERLCNHECLRAPSLQRLGRTSFDHQYKNYLRRYRPRLVNPVELHYS